MEQKKFKIIMLGDTNVGKTMLVSRFVKGVLPKNNMPTIGVEYKIKEMQLKNAEIVRVQIWDTAGQEKFKAVIKTHYRKSVGALLVYDITQEQSYHSIQKWMEEAKQEAEPNVVLMMVGNKIDLTDKNPESRKVQKEDAKMFALQNNMMFEESSAITSNNVDNIFMKLIEEIYNQQNDVPYQMNNNYILFNNDQREPRKGCCG